MSDWFDPIFEHFGGKIYNGGGHGQEEPAGFYFWTEILDYSGPYNSQAEAEQKLKEYLSTL